MLQVPLGVLEKCEQTAEDMIDIMRHVHKYVPQTESAGIVERIFFGGDQVTVERARGAQQARLQSKNRIKRFQGVIPKSEDWHALVTFYQVIINTMILFCSINHYGWRSCLIYILHAGYLESTVQNRLIYEQGNSTPTQKCSK